MTIFPYSIIPFSKEKIKLETILNIIDLKFDVIGITETKIKSGYPPFDINSNG